MFSYDIFWVQWDLNKRMTSFKTVSFADVEGNCKRDYFPVKKIAARNRGQVESSEHWHFVKTAPTDIPIPRKLGLKRSLNADSKRLPGVKRRHASADGGVLHKFLFRISTFSNDSICVGYPRSMTITRLFLLNSVISEAVSHFRFRKRRGWVLRIKLQQRKSSNHLIDTLCKNNSL